jgi:ketosteroid isomerase-like protein
MSQETMEIARAAGEALERADMDAVLALFDPAIEVFDHDIPDAPHSYRGVEGLERWQADWEASWASWRWEPDELIDAGDRVVTILRLHATGRESGVEVERLDGAVWTVRHDKVIRLDYYGSKDEALEAVGLR